MDIMLVILRFEIEGVLPLYCDDCTVLQSTKLLSTVNFDCKNTIGASKKGADQRDNSGKPEADGHRERLLRWSGFASRQYY